MTHEEMRQIADDADRLANGATAGPWIYREELRASMSSIGNLRWIVAGIPNSVVEEELHNQRANAAFIAACREMVPRLVAAVRSLVAEVDAAHAAGVREGLTTAAAECTAEGEDCYKMRAKVDPTSTGVLEWNAAAGAAYRCSSRIRALLAPATQPGKEGR